MFQRNVKEELINKRLDKTDARRAFRPEGYPYHQIRDTPHDGKNAINVSYKNPESNIRI
jgi:hypothetical protein